MKKIKSQWKKYNKWRKKHPILAWLSPRIHRLPDLPRDIKLSIKSFIQRGKKGYSSRDTWGLCYYLADVITNSVNHLKKYYHGHPANTWHMLPARTADITSICSSKTGCSNNVV